MTAALDVKFISIALGVAEANQKGEPRAETAIKNLIGGWGE